jgi:hypothetical protein
LKQIRRHLTYANVMSSIAVFMVLGGATAFAATKIGANQLKANSVKTGKIVKEAVTAGKIKTGAVTTAKLGAAAVTTDKLADNAVTTPKIADSAVSSGKIANDAVATAKIAANAVSTGKIADSAVTAAKLTASERSKAFQTQSTGLLNTEVSVGLLGSYTTALSVASTTLPAGQYVVMAKSEFLNSTLGEDRSVICRLYDDGVQIDQGSSPLGLIIIVSQGTVNTLGISDGGELNMRCRASGDDVFPFNREIVAIQVGSVN